MSNLLSPDILNESKSDYVARLLLSVFIVLGITALLGILIIFPAYISVRVDRISLEEQNIALQESASVVQNRQQRDALIEARKRIETLNAVFSEDNEVMDLLRTIVERRPSGVSLTGLQYTLKDGKKTTRISGAIDKRSQMKAYIDALESDKIFNSVNIPVSALAGAGRGLFVITAVGGSDI